jgi:hypothetical protein
MNDKSTIENLPDVSLNGLRGATAGLGGVLVNLFVYHALQYGQQRDAALERVVAIATDAVNSVGVVGTNENEAAESNALMKAIIRQAAENARKELVRRPEGDKSKIN